MKKQPRDHGVEAAPLEGRPRRIRRRGRGDRGRGQVARMPQGLASGPGASRPPPSRPSPMRRVLRVPGRRATRRDGAAPGGLDGADAAGCRDGCPSGTASSSTSAAGSPPPAYRPGRGACSGRRRFDDRSCRRALLADAPSAPPRRRDGRDSRRSDRATRVLSGVQQSYGPPLPAYPSKPRVEPYWTVP